MRAPITALRDATHALAAIFAARPTRPLRPADPFPRRTRFQPLTPTDMPEVALVFVTSRPQRRSR